MENVRRQHAHWLIPAGLGLLALALSSIPGNNMPQTGLWNTDKLIHCCEFAGIGFFFTRSLSRHVSLRLGTLVWAIACVAAFGCIDETYQRLTPGRDSSLNDMIADAAGAVIGVITWALWQRRTS